ELKNLGQRLGWLTLGTCAVLFSLGWLRGIGLLQMARSAMSVAVAAVPEGLPMVATTTFALGIEKLRSEGVLIRKLDAVETLAAARVVCFDKTGTLTLGHIDVDTIRIGENSYSINEDWGAQKVLCNLLEVCCLCNDAEIAQTEEGLRLNGSPTDCCL
ncbi:MAG: cation-transporting P-type ATPase, partial [Mesorhizobium sp.]